MSLGWSLSLIFCVMSPLYHLGMDRFALMIAMLQKFSNHYLILVGEDVSLISTYDRNKNEIFEEVMVWGGKQYWVMGGKQNMVQVVPA